MNKKKIKLFSVFLNIERYSRKWFNIFLFVSVSISRFQFSADGPPSVQSYAIMRLLLLLIHIKKGKKQIFLYANESSLTLDWSGELNDICCSESINLLRNWFQSNIESFKLYTTNVISNGINNLLFSVYELAPLLSNFRQSLWNSLDNFKIIRIQSNWRKTNRLKSWTKKKEKWFDQWPTGQ